MNELISIQRGILFTANSRLKIPATLSDQLLHLVGVSTLDYPKGLVFFTKLERLRVAETFIHFGCDWCNTYLPLGFSDKGCDQLVVVDSESQEIYTLDFNTLLDMCDDELDYTKVIDVEETIKASRLRAGTEPKGWLPGTEPKGWISYEAATTVAVVAAIYGFFIGWWSAQSTPKRMLDNELYGTPRGTHRCDTCPKDLPEVLHGSTSYTTTSSRSISMYLISANRS